MRSGKLLAFAIIFSFTSNIFGQTDQKNVRFGMLITPQLDWLRSGNIKAYNRDGVNGKFGFGLSLEFRLTDVVHFTTGIGGTFTGGTENYNVGGTQIGYYTDNSTNPSPIAIKDLNNELNAPVADQVTYAKTHFANKLQSRAYKATYVTIPVLLKMMTKPIGPLKYFGIFGGNLEVLTGAKGNDQVVLPSGSTTPIADLDISNDCNRFKASLNVGAGAEYVLSGTTALTFGINYYRAFTSLTSSTSGYLIQGNTSGNTPPQAPFAPSNNTGGYTNLTHKIYGDGFALTIGFLF
jgi:hypothetical protein